MRWRGKCFSSILIISFESEYSIKVFEIKNNELDGLAPFSEIQSIGTLEISAHPNSIPWPVEGTDIEKRELLGCLKNKIFLCEKTISIE